ncbi:hypothetical protein SBRY_20148 [Actinacidiphila bryophytorum]|uniref:Uncharacterized protein n=1 Tax=Actinacidiphila bryophytorum TaxID=1436133 RepID=A0A9W4GXY0_9ACTN|nr:hypothetical protein SBRY_20148 [Actinacidiphila bryophytorum]
MPGHVRLRHDAAGLGAARPRPRRLGGRRRGRRQPGPRHVVPPALPRRRVAAVRPAEPVRVRRPGPGHRPHLHPGRPAGRLGDPGGPGPHPAHLTGGCRRDDPAVARLQVRRRDPATDRAGTGPSGRGRLRP